MNRILLNQPEAEMVHTVAASQMRTGPMTSPSQDVKRTGEIEDVIKPTIATINNKFYRTFFSPSLTLRIDKL
jgi:hypothetical protein